MVLIYVDQPGNCSSKFLKQKKNSAVHKKLKEAILFQLWLYLNYYMILKESESRDETDYKIK